MLVPVEDFSPPTALLNAECKCNRDIDIVGPAYDIKKR